VYIDCYKLNGTKLWRIDLGVNIRAGAHYTQFLVYDFDGDGRAEMICKTAPGSKDGEGVYVNQATTDNDIKGADNTKDWRTPDGMIGGGQEYLTVFDGQTGKAIHTIFYNPNLNAGYGGDGTDVEFNWDDDGGYGLFNYANRYLAAVAYLDGRDLQPSAVMCRGYYTQSFLWAVDYKNGKLVHRWLHASMSQNEVVHTDAQWNVDTRIYETNTFGISDYCTAYGAGNHNLSVADVDGDGCDEIIYGGATIDNDGWLLYSTGLYHGDAMHVADLIPSRPGYEVFRCLEWGPPGLEIHDAKTGEMIFLQPAERDTGRCLAADISDQYEGFEFWGAQNNLPRESASGNFDIITEVMPSRNFRIYWDGDLQDELFDGSYDTGTGIAHPNITKWNGASLETTAIDYNGSQTCNGTKATPCIQADILGDWREELILWNLNNPSQLNIISTNIPSDYRVPTLMQDHNYRLAVAWQNVAYNQPPHLGYYLPHANFAYKSEKEPQPAKLTYTVNEVVDGNIVRSTIGEGTPGSEITVPYHRYNLLNGKLYLKDASGGPKGLEYNHYFTLTENNQVETINYEQTDIQDVVFFAEGEDIPGMTLCDNDNMRVRSSNCLAAYVADGSVGFVTLPAGSYRLTAFIHNSYKDPDSYWKFFAGDKEIANLHCTVVNIQELQSEVFTLNEKTTLYIPQCGDYRSGIDLIYITKININYDDDEPEHPDNEFETAAEAVKNMKVGYCLGNTLDAFSDSWIGETHSWQEYETVWGNPITKPEFMKMIRKAGFNAVRVSVTWFPHMDANGKVDETWMKRVHEIVDYVIDQGMYCILNSHHDTSHKDAWLWADDSYYKIQEQYQGLWSQIATEFKDYDEHLMFAGWNEILERQEVFGGESYKDRYKVLNQINQDFVDAVRSSGGNNVFRNLVVGPYYNWSVYEGDELPQHYIDSFQSLIVPNDINPGHILFEVHAYLKTSDPQVNKVLDRTIQDMNTYLASKKVPIVIGEWGPANKYDNPPQVDAFAHYFMEQTRTNNIATFAWNGPLSYGEYRNLPAFEEPSYIKAIMKGYYGDDYEPVLITTEDYDDEGHRKQFVHTVGFDKIWAELNIFSDDIPLKLKNYKGIRVEFAEPINVDDFGIKVYADNGAVEEGRTPNSSTSATILFRDFNVKDVINRVTLQYCKEAKGEAKVVSAWLIRQDDTEEYSDLSPFWGCEITNMEKYVPASGIEGVYADGQGNAVIFNINGQKLSKPKKGINIIGGKKVVVK
jgi:rhamnogalacturonan endolyase